MANPTIEQLKSILIGIMSDGFNHSINALRNAGAINTKKIDTDYKGIDSKYSDMVTEQLEFTAKYGLRMCSCFSKMTINYTSSSY